MADTKANARLEAFCDGVFAIALTLLIIEIRPPDMGTIASTQGLWLALEHLLPEVFAFVLSFIVILITWLNHHGALERVSGSSGSFVYANGLLLLTVVFIPFPTALLGSSISTAHAAPGVVLYNAVLVVQAVSWILVCGTALDGHLYTSDEAASRLREGRRNGYGACVLYALLAIAAFWFPRTVAALTAAPGCSGSRSAFA
jgi:uncharacterized membrane protein